MKDSAIKVTVIVTTYNHEKFIAKTLDSIFMQKGVSYEVLLADDCSTDKTSHIMQQYVDKYPSIARILERKENLGMCLNMYDAYHQAKGEYIAICEGDDFWISPYKLQKQAEFLDSHSEFSGTFNTYNCIKGNQIIPHGDHQHLIQKDQLIIDMELLVSENYIGNFSALMFRTKLVKQIEKSVFENTFIADWLTGMFLIDKGGPLFLLPEKMSAYLLHDETQWTSLSQKEKNEVQNNARKEYNRLFNFKYDNIFKKYMKRNSKRFLWF